MRLASIMLLGVSTLAFVGAASAAKVWARSDDSVPWLAGTLALYTFGNLIVLKLIRDVGMGVALGLSAAAQLLAVNIVAFAVFGERFTALQTLGLLLAAISIVMVAAGASGS